VGKAGNFPGETGRLPRFYLVLVDFVGVVRCETWKEKQRKTIPLI
jgi:hypothetical protein